MGNIRKGVDGNFWIITQRKKTKIPSNLPLLPKAEQLIEKYKLFPGKKTDSHILPSLSNQKIAMRQFRKFYATWVFIIDQQKSIRKAGMNQPDPILSIALLKEEKKDSKKVKKKKDCSTAKEEQNTRLPQLQ